MEKYQNKPLIFNSNAQLKAVNPLDFQKLIKKKNQNSIHRNKNIKKTQKYFEPNVIKDLCFKKQKKKCPFLQRCINKSTCKYDHSIYKIQKFFKRKKQCHLYQKGKCNLGSQCPNYHGNINLRNMGKFKYKTILCKQYQQKNFCHNGNLCIFAHSEKELRTIEQNKRLLQQQQQMENIASEQNEEQHLILELKQ